MALRSGPDSKSMKSWSEVSGAARRSDGRVVAHQGPMAGLLSKTFPSSSASALSPSRGPGRLPATSVAAGPGILRYGSSSAMQLGAPHTRCQSQGGSDHGSDHGTGTASARSSSRDPVGRDGDVSSRSSGCWEVDTASTGPTTPPEATPSPLGTKLPTSPAATRGLLHPGPVKCMPMQELFLGFVPPDRETSDNSTLTATPNGSSASGAPTNRVSSVGTTEVSPVVESGKEERSMFGVALKHDPLCRDGPSAGPTSAAVEPIMELITRTLHQITSNIQRHKQPTPEKLDKYVSNLAAHVHKKVHQIPRKEKSTVESMIAQRCDGMMGFHRFRKGADPSKYTRPSPEQLQGALALLVEDLVAEFGVSRNVSTAGARTTAGLSGGSGVLHMPRPSRQRGSSKRGRSFQPRLPTTGILGN